MVIKVDGELFAEGLPELDRARRSSEEPVRLDLSELNSVDASAIEALLALRAQGVMLNGLSTYIIELLERRSRQRAGAGTAKKVQ